MCDTLITLTDSLNDVNAPVNLLKVLRLKSRTTKFRRPYTDRQSSLCAPVHLDIRN